MGTTAEMKENAARTTGSPERPPVVSKVVSRGEWLAARKNLLAKEKELTRARDALNAERRQLPWVTLAEIQAFKRRIGWKFNWVSSYGSDFNFDYHVSFTPEEIASGRVYYNYDWREFVSDELSGRSVFYKDESGQIFHTYSFYGRGTEEVLGTYVHLDITPKGRNENGPHFTLADWVRHHDRYGHGGSVDRKGRYIADAKPDSCCHSPGEQ